MTGETVLPHAVLDLLARRRACVKYTAVMPLGRAKKFHTAAAAAALCGYTLVRTEDDDGSEAFIATRGAETLRFQNLSQVDNWGDSLIAMRASCRLEEAHGADR